MGVIVKRTKWGEAELDFRPRSDVDSSDLSELESSDEEEDDEDEEEEEEEKDEGRIVKAAVQTEDETVDEELLDSGNEGGDED